MSEPLFTERHYKVIAATLDKAWTDGATVDDEEILNFIVDKLIEMFKEDNPSFNEEMFLDALGYAEEKS